MFDIEVYFNACFLSKIVRYYPRSVCPFFFIFIFLNSFHVNINFRLQTGYVAGMDIMAADVIEMMWLTHNDV